MYIYTAQIAITRMSRQLVLDLPRTARVLDRPELADQSFEHGLPLRCNRRLEACNDNVRSERQCARPALDGESANEYGEGVPRGAGGHCLARRTVSARTWKITAVDQPNSSIPFIAAAGPRSRHPLVASTSP